MKDCIFCSIVKSKDCYLIYEDNLFMAFLDIFPRVKGHTLVIPKKHYRWVYDVPKFGQYWEVVNKITKKMQESFKPDFITYVTHGLEVPHAHIHIMPRANSTEFVPPQIQTTREELNIIKNKLKLV